MALDPNTRARALELMRQGRLTHAEAAMYLDVSRQAMRDLCRRAGIDALMARHLYIKRMFECVEPRPK